MHDKTADPRVEVAARFMRSREEKSCGWEDTTLDRKALLIDTAERLLVLIDAVDPLRATSIMPDPQTLGRSEAEADIYKDVGKRSWPYVEAPRQKPRWPPSAASALASPGPRPLPVKNGRLWVSSEKTAARIQDAICDAIAILLGFCSPKERTNYLRNSGYQKA